jgi:hypothetical protein
MIANANYGGTEPTYDNWCGSSGPSISFRNFDAPINLFKEDGFYPEEVCRKSIQMENKRFVPSVATRINRGRG